MLEAILKMKLFYPIRPWEDEPDRADWIQEVSGYKCRIIRNEGTGSLCGYVGIPKGHRFFGVGYDEDRDKELGDIADHVHGGLTYSALDGGWWYFGFDTNHYDDFAPKMVEHYMMRGYEDLGRITDCTKYKTWEFVDDQIFWLGKRLWQYNEYAKEDRHA
jgi:hypothetical protein